MQSASREARRAEAAAVSRYASAQQTADLLARGQAWRTMRLAQADIVSTDQAARLLGTSRETINNWIGDGRCIGLLRPVRGYRLPRWQFEPAIRPHLRALSHALGTTEGWALLLFLETPHEALDGRTPRMALEQGEAGRVIDLAAAEATGER